MSGLDKIDEDTKRSIIDELIIDANHQKERVNHPDHYNQGSMEVIDAIDGLGFAEGFCVGNIIKYVSRHEYKNGKEDLDKALWYLKWLIDNKYND